MSATVIGACLAAPFLLAGLYGWVYERGYNDGRQHAVEAARRAYQMREEER